MILQCRRHGPYPAALRWEGFCSWCSQEAQLFVDNRLRAAGMRVVYLTVPPMPQRDPL